ncbi:MAG: TVP38/TMEM64 family protein, partial [Proteobacteria bacterium]|nr:TVP38/TMEM64 family protein [Pseudomonadota bacterium]
MIFAFLRRLLPVAILLLGLALFFVLELERHLSFETLSRNHAELEQWVADHGALAALAFVAAYAAIVAFSLPVAAFATAVSGFLFGIRLGAVLSVAGATLGAMALFVAARSAFYDLFHARAGHAVQRLEDGFRRHSFSYLLFLRLVPLFPFWLVNIVAALLGMRFDA